MNSTPALARTALVLMFFLASCSPSQDPESRLAEAPTEEWVRSYYDTFAPDAFDVDRLMTFYSAEVRFTDPTFDIEVFGRDEVRKLYANTGTAVSQYSETHWDIDRVIIGGLNDVAIHGVWAGNFQGKPFEVQFVTLWRLEAGLIVEQIDFFDAATFDEQVGWTG